MTYNENNQEIERITYNWIGTGWDYYDKLLTEYDGDKIVQKIVQKYRQEEWVDLLRTTLTYNDNDKLTEYKNQILIGDNWKKNSLVTYDYTPTQVNDNTHLITKLQAFPNPAQNRTNIEFYLNNPSNVTLQLINENGKMVINSNLGYFLEGNNMLNLNLNNLSSGFYSYILFAGDEIFSGKFIITK